MAWTVATAQSCLNAMLTFANDPPTSAAWQTTNDQARQAIAEYIVRLIDAAQLIRSRYDQL